MTDTNHAQINTYSDWFWENLLLPWSWAICYFPVLNITNLVCSNHVLAVLADLLSLFLRLGQLGRGLSQFVFSFLQINTNMLLYYSTILRCTDTCQPHRKVAQQLRPSGTTDFFFFFTISPLFIASYLLGVTSKIKPLVCNKTISKIAMMLMMIFLQVHYCTIFTPFHFACDSQDASNYVFLWRVCRQKWLKEM